jgi:[ribosomal protein S5]-alanine N-acetyltransferase
MAHVLPLLTPRLRLRALEAADLEDLTAVYTHPAVLRWIGPQSRETAAKDLHRQIAHQAELGYSFWAVEDRATGAFLGECGLQPLEGRGPEVELGYDFHPGAWGRGLGSEAARAVVDAAFGPLGLTHVIAVVREDHAASRRVLAKAGLAHTGERVAYGIPMLVYEATPPDRRV